MSTNNAKVARTSGQISLPMRKIGEGKIIIKMYEAKKALILRDGQ